MDAVILSAVLPGIRDELTELRVTKAELVGKYGVFLRFGGVRPIHRRNGRSRKRL